MTSGTFTGERNAAWRLTDWLAVEIGEAVELPRAEAAGEPILTTPWGMAGWYVAHVLARREAEFVTALRGHGFQAFAPMRKLVVRVGSKKRPTRITKPLLPGYVFFSVEAHPRNWTLVWAEDALIAILVGANGAEPVRVPGELVGDYMAAQDMGLLDESIRPGAIEFIRGDRVTILAGGYQGYSAQIEKVEGNQAQVSVDAPGGKRSTKLPLDRLQILA